MLANDQCQKRLDADVLTTSRPTTFSSSTIISRSTSFPSAHTSTYPLAGGVLINATTNFIPLRHGRLDLDFG
jgi:hypothetical protein